MENDTEAPVRVTHRNKFASEGESGTGALRITDEDIIDLFWLRDERAIQETARKYGKMIFRIANNILHDNADSEECQNDTYLRVWKCIPPTRPSFFLRSFQG